MNVEGMYSVYFIKRLSKAKPPFDILRFDIRHSAVRFPRGSAVDRSRLQRNSLFGHAESHTRVEGKGQGG